MALRSLQFLLFLLAAAATATAAGGDACSLAGCNALASYLIQRNQNLTYVAALFGYSDYRDLKAFNPGVSNLDYIQAGQSVNISFTCGCQSLPNSPSTSYLAGSFPYKVAHGETYGSIATNFSGLTNDGWLAATNIYPATNIPDTGVTVNVNVNCSCGDRDVSLDYGLFLTYPLNGQTLDVVAANYSFSSPSQLEMLSKYNPNMPVTNTTGLVFIPVKGACFVALVPCELERQWKLPLFIATRKAAIKKMDMQASHEFLAELKVLTHVHHLNLVRLIGYCTEGSLFLVYEYIENGNLSQHLRGTGYEPLSWAARVQIALDSARGLEYIHEHTVPVYIHRDIKSANILIDKNYRAKVLIVADFGLTKLTEVGNTSLPTRGIVGTFGYMPPEYARYGDVSPKVDVYAFGVVLYELISAKDAIVRSTESASDSKGLVYLFEEALNTPDPKEGLKRLIDPALGEDYPIDSILKLTVLARACTQEDPKARPTMRSVVVALMTLSSTSEFWDMNALHENQGLVNLMSGR
nr:unnamed protein product [Digitaria exilis]